MWAKITSRHRCVTTTVERTRKEITRPQKKVHSDIQNIIFCDRCVILTSLFLQLHHNPLKFPSIRYRFSRGIKCYKLPKNGSEKNRAFTHLIVCPFVFSMPLRCKHTTTRMNVMGGDPEALHVAPMYSIFAQDLFTIVIKNPFRVQYTIKATEKRSRKISNVPFSSTSTYQPTNHHPEHTLSLSLFRFGYFPCVALPEFQYDSADALLCIRKWIPDKNITGTINNNVW